MTRKLFHAIDELFHPNEKDDIVREEPISLKKLRKGDATWTTKKVIIGWSTDMAKQVLTVRIHRIRMTEVRLESVYVPDVRIHHLPFTSTYQPAQMYR